MFQTPAFINLGKTEKGNPLFFYVKKIYIAFLKWDPLAEFVDTTDDLGFIPLQNQVY